jgi:hypothetical protein
MLHAIKPPIKGEWSYSSFRPFPFFAWEPSEVFVRVHDDVAKTVLFLGDAENKPFSPHGTAFLVAQTTDVTEGSSNRGWQAVVTARHVIEGIKSKDVYGRLNDLNGNAALATFPKEGWYFHPDKRIDVAVYPCFLPKDQFEFKHFPIGPLSDGQIPDHALTEAIIARQDIGIGSEVYVAGMFVGRLGEKKNIPILRIGTIAAMAGEPITTEYGQHDAFLLEVRSIDGLSGSPACVHMPTPVNHPNVLIDPRTVPPPHLGYYLMGMILGYNEVLNPTDNILVAGRSYDPNRKKKRVLAPMNTGIAVVLPIWRILEALNQPTIKSARETILSKGDGNRKFVATSVASAELGPPAEPDEKSFASVSEEENPQHQEDFTALLNVAAKTKARDD